ncbi:MAG: tetratricopeptide repeat protein [Verrucomicrobia bacterium]|jgi:tetratricopeptide (TPR) repeat protein|nr:tetratricopeptide repeat protein [Verrucomicrobiota bacterium]|tara:strand:- start:1071 stop:1814 length:744 start_codon:yes stop_codon:yes gene_type:complete
MKTIKLITLGFLLLGGLVQGADFKQANAAYAAGKYSEAAKSYEEILKADGPHISVLRNVGSAYYQMGENGKAILAFERALVLTPRDPDLLANLKLAQDQVAVYPVAEGSAWQSFLERYSTRAWSKIALVTAMLLPFAALAWCFRKGKERIGIGMFAAANLTMLALAFAGLDARSGEYKRGIIIGKPATVRISPFEKADDRGTLGEGREVTLGQETSGYFWVTADGGRQEGWVAADEVVPVVPERKMN